MTENEEPLGKSTPNPLSVVRMTTNDVINRTTEGDADTRDPFIAGRLRAWEHTASAYRRTGTKLITGVPIENDLELTDVADRLDQLMELCVRGAIGGVETDDLLAALQTLRQVRARLVQAEKLFIEAASALTGMVHRVPVRSSEGPMGGRC